MRTIAIGAIVLGLGLMAGASVAKEATPAKVLFGSMTGPAPLAARSVGFYSRGCVAGAEALAHDGPGWQVMRLSRNRNWGMPQLVAYIEKLARDGRERDGWPGLLVGDMSQPRGGPMKSGHASHQIGLDVDIWFTPMPDHTLTAREREETSARSLIKPGSNTVVDPALWDDGLFRIIRRAASYPEVDRIFVNAGIKQKLCEMAGRDRAWLRKVRPWYKHDDHLHVRLACPPGLAGCKAQDPAPQGDGCGPGLAWWLSPEPYKPPKTPVKLAPELTLADLPPSCADILKAGGGTTEAGVKVPIPPPRPAIN